MNRRRLATLYKDLFIGAVMAIPIVLCAALLAHLLVKFPITMLILALFGVIYAIAYSLRQ